VGAEELAGALSQLAKGTSLQALAQLEENTCEHFGVSVWSDLGHGASLLATLCSASTEPCIRDVLGPESSSSAVGGGAGGCSLEDVLQVIHAVAGGWESGE
jgi:hypothetical protein